MGPRNRQAKGRRTCLYCYEPFRVERGPEACPGCAAVQSRQDQERWWSREPGLLRWQRSLQVAGVALTAAVGVLLARVMDPAMLPWGLGLLGAMGGFLFYTAGSVTRRQSFMELRFLWPLLIVGLGLGPLVISVGLRAIQGDPVGWAQVRPGLQWMALWALPLAISLWLPGRFARFRMERLKTAVYSRK